MMSKPIDKVEFWEERLERAKAEGRIEDSVFATTNGTWVNINRVHEQILKTYICKSHSVLDAGCGYGRAYPLIANLCSVYVGIDFVGGFIREAPLDTRDGDLFLRRDIRNTGFPNKCFDWVVGISLMTMTINNLGQEQWDLVRKELLRVSKNGVICLEYTDPEIYCLVRKA